MGVARAATLVMGVGRVVIRFAIRTRLYWTGASIFVSAGLRLLQPQTSGSLLRDTGDLMVQMKIRQCLELRDPVSSALSISPAKRYTFQPVCATINCLIVMF